jgi:hypothetical protein
MPHQARSDLCGEPDALRLAARERAGAAVEAQIVEPDAEEQFQAATNLFQHMAPGVRTTAGGLHGGEKRLQLVEVELPDLEDRLAFDGEQESGRAQPRALAVRTRVLDHHLVEPLLHLRIGFTALTIPAIPALDPPRDAVEADLLAFVIVAPDLGFRWRRQHHLLRVDP